MGIGRKNLLRALHRLDVKSIEIKNCDVRDKIALYGQDSGPISVCEMDTSADKGAPAQRL